jgi:hypothetical protein
MLKKTLSILACISVLAACGSDGEVADEASAEAAYLGLDVALQKAMQLGFDGFNAADSANIPPQSTTGDATGTMEVTGQVDQGASANKGMRLYVELIEYSDETDPEADFLITYDTDPEDLPYLDIQLRNIPDGTFSGSFTGTVAMSGGLTGIVTLDIAFSGEIEEDPEVPGDVRRVEGSTSVTGTASSRYGTYAIDLVI